MKTVIAAAALLASLSLVACTHSLASPAEARRHVEAGALLVDVRSPEEFASGHLPGAVNIPVEELPKRLEELGSPEEPLVIYCRSGMRSSRAERLLKERGFQRIVNLGPMSAWE